MTNQKLLHVATHLPPEWTTLPAVNPLLIGIRPPSPESSAPRTSSPNHGQFSKDRDLLIAVLWEKQTACVIDMIMIDSDQPSYHDSIPAQALASQEKVKNKNYAEMCFKQRRHFSPYVVCTSRLLFKEAKALTNKRLSLILTRKRDTHYRITCGYVTMRISVAILQASHLCIQRSCAPFRYASTKITRWDDGAGLKLLRT